MELMTIDEVAELLRVPKGWLYQRTRHGNFPGMMKMGKYLRFNKKELIEYIASGKGFDGIK